ncbi:MAG: hypothetical protein AAFR94_00040 [Pseudomonadota bacterium]
MAPMNAPPIRSWLLGSILFSASGCADPKTDDSQAAGAPPVSAQETPYADYLARPERDTDPLAWAVAGPWRGAEETVRDAARNPVETLSFFGVKPSDTVIELWPGGGWYSAILVPYLASGGGSFIAAGFDPEAFDGERRAQMEARVEDYRARLDSVVNLFGPVSITAFSEQSGPLAPDGTADVVLTFRNLHNWMAGGYADKVFVDAFAALKPGGTLGVVEHRLPSAETQDPTASNGYVHEDYVKAAAERAGFVFVESSEINANPADRADHPFGVWTLPPNNRAEDANGNAPADFDPAIYIAIGESDRMTLKFTKPGTGESADEVPVSAPSEE